MMAILLMSSVFGAVQEAVTEQSLIETGISSQLPSVVKQCDAYRIVKEEPTRDKYWEKLGLETLKHKNIVAYKIQWFSGAWSDWFITGDNDVDWKHNLDGSKRRVWSYFTDHNHIYIQCISGNEQPIALPSQPIALPSSPVDQIVSSIKLILDENDAEAFRQLTTLANEAGRKKFDSSYDLNNDGLVNEADAKELLKMIDFFDSYLSKNGQLDAKDINVYSQVITEENSDILGNSEFDWNDDGSVDVLDVQLFINFMKKFNFFSGVLESIIQEPISIVKPLPIRPSQIVPGSEEATPISVVPSFPGYKPKPKPKPIILPVKEEFKAYLVNGWNLVTLPSELVKFENKGCAADNKLKAYVWIKEEQKYLSLPKAKDYLGSRFNKYLATNGFWIHSLNQCTFYVEVTGRDIQPQEISLVAGWNLVPSKNTEGSTRRHIEKFCDNATYFVWDEHSQSWIRASNDLTTMLVKTEKPCKLSSLLSGEIPSFPEISKVRDARIRQIGQPNIVSIEENFTEITNIIKKQQNIFNSVLETIQSIVMR